MLTITFLGSARRRKPRLDTVIIILIIIFDIIINQVSIPNIADYYDSRISKKENDKTVVRATHDEEDGGDNDDDDAGEATVADGNLQSKAFKEDKA